MTLVLNAVDVDNHPTQPDPGGTYDVHLRVGVPATLHITGDNALGANQALAFTPQQDGCDLAHLRGTAMIRLDSSVGLLAVDVQFDQTEDHLAVCLITAGNTIRLPVYISVFDSPATPPPPSEPPTAPPPPPAAPPQPPQTPPPPPPPPFVQGEILSVTSRVAIQLATSLTDAEVRNYLHSVAAAMAINETLLSIERTSLAPSRPLAPSRRSRQLEAVTVSGIDASACATDTAIDVVGIGLSTNDRGLYAQFLSAATVAMQSNPPVAGAVVCASGLTDFQVIRGSPSLPPPPPSPETLAESTWMLLVLGITTTVLACSLALLLFYVYVRTSRKIELSGDQPNLDRAFFSSSAGEKRLYAFLPEDHVPAHGGGKRNRRLGGVGGSCG